jgi:hypothetical protein
MTTCLKCGGPAEDRFRLVMGRGRMERLCPGCADQLSALVRAAGETAQLSLADTRFVSWLESGQWTTREGRIVGPEDIPGDWHGPECPCCATFAEE